ncbi:uncharacterized protein LOC125065314 [Vanessa atalanta]|uniref:uncharacterized protein LOC125065314 n=1 Tax=Vanessa atalanta TaxID=42275 RepID=UPI001FCD48D8|nr:uncharacterized protein LOC125065314 [Vanessa atalanta]
MYFKCVLLFFLIYVTASPAIASSNNCNEFTITVDEIDNVNDISTFDRDSFGILNNLTNQCRFLNIAIELDLYRDEKTSKHYVDLYGDDLHKINITYPINDYVSEEVDLTSNIPKLFENPRNKPTTHEYDVAETYEHETTTDYRSHTTNFEATEITTTDTSGLVTNDDGGISDVEQLKKEDNGKTAIIAAASVAAVASVAVASYFIAEMIKTMLQSGSFRFPEPNA